MSRVFAPFFRIEERALSIGLGLKRSPERQICLAQLHGFDESIGRRKGAPFGHSPSLHSDSSNISIRKSRRLEARIRDLLVFLKHQQPSWSCGSHDSTIERARSLLVALCTIESERSACLWRCARLGNGPARL